VVTATNPHGVNFGFLDRSRYFSIQIAHSSCCEKPVAEARGYLGDPEQGERPPLKPLPENWRKTEKI
jgi:hypothetical protein